MKRIFTVITLLLIINSAASAESDTEFRKLVNSAKGADKCILIKVFGNDPHSEFFDTPYQKEHFIEASLYLSDYRDAEIIRKYNVNAFPSVIVLNPDGNLLLPVKKVNTPREIDEYADLASKVKSEPNPMAQQDLDYGTNKMNAAAMLEYIEKRTSYGMDNGEVMDKYVSMVAPADMFNKRTLLLFLENNNINVPGACCFFVKQNQEKIKTVLQLSDERFVRLIDKSIEFRFDNICKNSDEFALSQIVDLKSSLSSIDKALIENEYATKYFYGTRQPLKLMNQSRIYADLIMQHYERTKAEQPNPIKSKRSSIKDKKSPLSSVVSLPVAHAARLRNLSQYVVETLSVKSILDDALTWSIFAEQISNTARFDIPETRAYILYKLGRKDEAVEVMEKAYASVPHDNLDSKKLIGLNLIKMKRGDKIY
ncbi:MAG: thioredoxin family protein [Prevotellaceae bacterium]|jgi:tetratricopeptide (TPR) repeat protein|nr:thioredoxin family protein [Prevotellaceae bacterium]